MMRIADLFDYLALRRHLAKPLAFLRLRTAAAGDGPLDIRLRGGGAVRIRPGTLDRHILHRIFARDEYRLGRLPPGSPGTVIDVGAHIGAFAVRAAPVARRVLAFEPDPESFALLFRNTASFPNVTAVRRAVAGRPGRTILRLAAEPAARSTVTGDGPGGGIDRIEVESTTIAAIFEEHGVASCALLKLDAEGAEHEALAAVPRELWPRIERVAAEVHPVPGRPDLTVASLAAILRGAGHAVEVVRRRGRPGSAHVFSRLAAGVRPPQQS